MALRFPAHIVPVLAAAAAGYGLFRIGRAARGVPTALGARAAEIAAAGAGSPAFDGGVFHNRLPSTMLTAGTAPKLIAALIRHGDTGRPVGPVPLATPDLSGAPADLAVTWLGHATALIEIDGYRVLADPVFADRVSPSERVGPHRMHAVPVDLDRLPELDAVLISHDHYDHLELSTVRALAARGRMPFVVPLGVGAHLRRWGIPPSRIIELDWDNEALIGDLRLVCTEARHFSGRRLRRNPTLWSSWALAGPRHRVFFGGDTGYTPAFAEIGARFGGFDLAVLPIGAYGPQWPDIHLNPEEAWQAHGDLGGQTLLPIHWATFDLALHTWSEPIERLIRAAGDRSDELLIPRPGARIDLSAGQSDRAIQAADTWWQQAAGVSERVSSAGLPEPSRNRNGGTGGGVRTDTTPTT